VRAGADSLVGKALAAFKPADDNLLGRLPNLQYAIAAGLRDVSVERRQEAEKRIDIVLEDPAMEKIPAQTKRDYKRLSLDLDEQIKGVQLVAGPIAVGKGQVGAAVVLECKSAAETRKILKSLAPVVSEFLKHAGRGPWNELVFRYDTAVDESAEGGIDAIALEVPGISSMSEEDRRELVGLIGTDKLQFLVRQVDAGTLVVTLGGGREFLALAAKAAAGGESLAKDPVVAKAMASLPKNRIFVGMLDVANTWDVIKKVAQSSGAGEMPVLKLDTHVPIMVAGWVEGSNVCVQLDVPTDPVRQVTQAVADAISHAMRNFGGGPPPPVLPPDVDPDF
jgi:hypothetical protein